MTHSLRLAAIAVLLCFSVAASAQNAPRDRASGDRAERHLERLTERLSLTGSQVAMVRASIEGERTPGASWDLAARLAPTLSASQLEALNAPRQRGDRAARGERRTRDDRPASGGRAERRSAQNGDRAERREQMAEARAQALGLSDAQEQALKAARAQRPQPGADILTDEQQTIMRLHRALAPRGARRGGRR